MSMKRYAKLTHKEMSDSGQALVLLCLLLFLIFSGGGWIWAALAALVLNMACPRVFRGFAFLWLNFALMLGIVVSHIVMAAQFFLLVTPLGLARRCLGRDSLSLGKWKRGNESVFMVRDHAYKADDLRNPY